jgi:hypothetical protein
MLGLSLFPRTAFFLLLLYCILQIGGGEGFRVFKSDITFSPACSAAEEPATIKVFPGLGDIAEAILKGKG